MGNSQANKTAPTPVDPREFIATVDTTKIRRRDAATCWR